jgi:two-component system response regulator AtoC
MTPREFLSAQRTDLLARFEAFLGCEQPLDVLARDLQDFLSEVNSLVRDTRRATEAPLADKEALLVGGSAAMISLRARVGQLSNRSRAAVLIVGESGVGKRHTARALHRATYPEGAWFEPAGHDAIREIEGRLATLRAATSAQAEGGTTIFIDELGETAPELQAQLLRLLDEQRAPIRLVVSSSWPLVELARMGRVRKSLLFRFSNQLSLPPLAERKEDIASLVAHFCELTAESHEGGLTTFTPDALSLLCEHTWPGNLTELRSVIEGISANFGAGPVDAADLPDLDDRPSGAVFKLTATGVDLAELERQLLFQALALAGNNQTRAASLLGLTRDQIRYRMAKHDVLSISGRSE